jgi:hypothetical protein
MGEGAKDETQWLPSALPLWELYSYESCECSEPWLERKASTKLGPHDTINKALKCKCLKWARIVHLNLIFMNYDQKKGWESNWEFDFRPQIPWMQWSNDVWLGRVIHHWKDLFEGYLCIFFKNLIWKIYEHPKFWDNKSPNFKTIIVPILGVLGKSDIWM